MASRKRSASRKIGIQRGDNGLKVAVLSRWPESAAMRCDVPPPLSSFSATPVISRARPSRTSHAILEAASS